MDEQHPDHARLVDLRRRVLAEHDGQHGQVPRVLCVVLLAGQVDQVALAQHGREPVDFEQEGDLAGEARVGDPLRGATGWWGGSGSAWPIWGRLVDTLILLLPQAAAASTARDARPRHASGTAGAAPGPAAAGGGPFHPCRRTLCVSTIWTIRPVDPGCPPGVTGPRPSGSSMPRCGAERGETLRDVTGSGLLAYAP
jgi:hypothetical protein